MLKHFDKIGHALAITAIVNLNIYDIAVAQTMTIEQGYDAANSSLFKPDINDLFTGEGPSVSIDGISDPLNTQTFFGGSRAFTTEENRLPAAVDYEDLFSARDQQLNDMSEAVGPFTPYEQQSLSILLGSQGVSSVRGKAFLDPSIDILTDDEASSEFGDCRQEITVGTEEYDYDDRRVEYCERSNVDIPPILANRSYRSPRHNVSYASGTCNVAGQTIQVDSQATCVKLAAFAEIPRSAIRAVACVPTGTANGCVAFIYGLQSPTNDRGEIVDRIRLRPNVLASSAQFQIETSYAGNASRPMNFNVYVDGAPINSNRRSGTFASTAIQDAPSALHTFRWTVGVSPAEAVRIGTCPENCIYISRGTHEGHDYQFFQFLVYKGVEYVATRGLFGSTHTPLPTQRAIESFWSIIAGPLYNSYSYAHNSSGISVDAAEDWAPAIDPPLRFEGAISPATHQSSLRIRDHPRNGLRSVRLRVRFQEKAFGDWSYNADNFQRLQELIQAGICRANYRVVRSAPYIPHTSCVRAAVGNSIRSTSTGITGAFCGDQIPVAPFDASPNRAATNLRITPICDANGSYGSTSNCGKYESDPQCVKTGETCIEESDGTCNVYEDQWTCGSTTTYTTPTVQTVDVCESDLTCMGGNCFPDTTESGAQSLAETVAKLTAVDMIAADMTCTPGTDPSSITGLDECSVFVGEDQRCRRVVLGLADCCETPDGVSLADYIQLAFAMSRLNKVMTSAGYSNAFTSAWSSLETLGRDSWSSLSRPLTEVWDSIIGNSRMTRELSGPAAEGLLASVKQEIMKKAAEWVTRIFGEQAANVLFMNATTGGAAMSGGVATGPIAFSSTVQTVMNAVSIAFTVYTVLSILIDVLFACEDQELDLGVGRAIKSTHEIGTYCSNRFIICTIRKTTYCKFSSPLSRIMNEQIRLQLGIGWGTPEEPNCQGFTVNQLNSIDMERIDLSEWTGMLVSTGQVSADKANVDDLTGSSSTLGNATRDLFTRENAVERTQNKLGDANQADLLQDATTDFGVGLTSN